MPHKGRAERGTRRINVDVRTMALSLTARTGGPAAQPLKTYRVIVAGDVLVAW
jgi:hypothetical protein